MEYLKKKKFQNSFFFLFTEMLNSCDDNKDKKLFYMYR